MFGSLPHGYVTKSVTKRRRRGGKKNTYDGVRNEELSPRVQSVRSQSHQSQFKSSQIITLSAKETLYRE